MSDMTGWSYSLGNTSGNYSAYHPLAGYLDKIEDQLIGLNDQLSTMNELMERLILYLEASGES